VHKSFNITSRTITSCFSDHQPILWQVEEIKSIERRTIQVVNKKLAQEISIEALWSSQEFLESIESQAMRAGSKVLTNLNPRKIEREWFHKIVNTDGTLISNASRKNILEINEQLRFSDQSHIAFQDLKAIFKYDRFRRVACE